MPLVWVFEKIVFVRTILLLQKQMNVLEKAACSLCVGRRNARSDQGSLELLAPPFLSREKVENRHLSN
jgi:hypothetical protein